MSGDGLVERKQGAFGEGTLQLGFIPLAAGEDEQLCALIVITIDRACPQYDQFCKKLTLALPERGDRSSFRRIRRMRFRSLHRSPSSCRLSMRFLALLSLFSFGSVFVRFVNGSNER